MKKFTKLFTLLLTLFSITSCDLFTDVNPEKPEEPTPVDPEPIEHICNHICEECGKCLDDTCNDPVCKEKCLGHEKPIEFRGQTLYIYTVNDLHGAAEKTSSNPGLARMSYIINQKRQQYGEENVLFLSAGDNYQGQFISNVSEGRVVVDCFNKMKLDGTTIGNHEFDWGLDKIAKYCDGNEENGEALFDVGCANLYYANSDTRPEWLKEYFTYTKGALKVGVIPTIGYGLETSIKGSLVANYTFRNPIPIIKDLAKKLRSEEKCDVIIVDSHDGGYSTYFDESRNINETIAGFDGESRVDVIINGHTHKDENDTISQASGGKLYTIQAGCNSESYGEVVLNIDENRRITQGYSNSNQIDSGAENGEISSIVYKYVEETEELANTKLAKVGENITSKSKYYDWCCDCILKATNADIAITNNGGIRAISASGYLYTNTYLTVKDLYAIMPFDNTIMYSEVKGKLLKSFYNNYGTSNIIALKDFSQVSSLQDNTTYKVAIIDYVAEKTYLSSTFVNDTYRASDYLFRDLLQEDIIAQQAKYGNFKPSRNSVLGE